MFKKALAFVVLVSFFPGCSGTPPHAKDFLLMDTFVRIEIIDAMNEDMKMHVIERVIARMKHLERKFNYFSEESELAMINNLRKDKKLIVSPEMLRVLELAKELHIKTKGGFDVSLGSNNWRLDQPERTVWFTKDGIKIDLGGIAKGFIVDDGIALLRELGITNALINAGGDLYCLGKGPKGRGWKVGVRSPRDPEEILEILKVRDKGVATSGGYERPVKAEGKTVSHIIDPKTGKPVEDIFKSVTVVANDCATADALATGLYTMDPREAIATIQEIDGADCIIIDINGLMYTSGGIPEQT